MVLPSLTGFVLSFFQPVSLDGPAQDSVHSVLSPSSLPAVGSSCRGTDWPCRERLNLLLTLPRLKTSQNSCCGGDGPWGRGRTTLGISSGSFWAVSPSEVAGGAPCCPQDAGEAVNKLEQLFFALVEYSLGSHWMHDFTVSLAFPARLRLCCKF